MMDDDRFRRSADAFFDGVRGTRGTGELAERTVELLNRQFSHYRWVGIYWLKGDKLVLGPWRGPAATEHTSIPLGSGVCGAAAASGTVENVPDVSRDSRYLACFLGTKSEIVVPLFRHGSVMGEIDIDGDETAAFGGRDEAFLRDVAALFEQTATENGDV